MNSNSTDTKEAVALALRSAADELCRMDSRSAERADAVIAEALQTTRHLVASGRISASDWPSAELALCRRLAETASQYWERLRARHAASDAQALPTFWLG